GHGLAPLLARGYRTGEAGSAWASASCAASAGSALPAARLAGGGGGETAGRGGPAPAAPPAAGGAGGRPRRKALVDAWCSASPRAGWPRAAIVPTAAYAAPTDWCATAATGAGTAGGMVAAPGDDGGDLQPEPALGPVRQVGPQPARQVPGQRGHDNPGERLSGER